MNAQESNGYCISLFTWARISALGVDTGQGVSTFSIDGTFRSARRWCTDVALKTNTSCNFIEGPAASIWTTGIIETWINGATFSCGYWN